MISGDIWAGAEAQVYQTLRALTALETVQLSCVLFNDGLLAENLLAVGIPPVLLDEQQVGAVELIAGLRKVVARCQPNIVHVHAVKEHVTSVLACRHGRGAPAIVRTVHGSRSVPMGLGFGKRLRSSIVVQIDNFSIRHLSDGLVAVSADLASQLARMNPRGVVRQIHNGVDVDGTSTSPRDAGRRRRSGAEGKFWIGTAARLAEPKNLPMLIRAAARLKASRAPFVISVFGEGPLRQRLVELIGACDVADVVRLEGFEPDIGSILRSLDAFVLSSFHEGMPMALLEAMSASVPVVCTAVGGIPEVVTGGENGLLVPSDDDRALAQALMELMANQEMARRLGTRARASISSGFSVEARTRELIALYSDLKPMAGGRE
ncbi:MAG TPA: glycosyltransferase family 4 protein [Vicinamibacterales bacterium]